MTSSLTFMGDLLGMGVCAFAALRLMLGGRRWHWPLCGIAFVTYYAYFGRLFAPELWTPTVYIAFEGAVGALTLFVGSQRPWLPQAALFAACLGAGLYLSSADPGACASAYVLLACASGTAAACVYDSDPHDHIEKIARLGLGALLAFQAARGLLAYAACDAPVLVAMLSSAGWAVHMTAFGLIAWAARRG